MEKDAAVHSGATADFLNSRLDDIGMPEKSKLLKHPFVLRDCRNPRSHKKKCMQAMQAIGENSESV